MVKAYKYIRWQANEPQKRFTDEIWPTLRIILGDFCRIRWRSFYFFLTWQLTLLKNELSQ